MIPVRFDKARACRCEQNHDRRDRVLKEGVESLFMTVLFARP